MIQISKIEQFGILKLHQQLFGKRWSSKIQTFKGSILFEICEEFLVLHMVWRYESLISCYDWILLLDIVFGMKFSHEKETLISFALVAKLEGKLWQGHLCCCNTCSIVIIVNVLDLDTGPNTKSVWWFQIFLYVYPYLGEMIQFDGCICFRWFGSTTKYQIGFRKYSWVFPKMVGKPLFTPQVLVII